MPVPSNPVPDEVYPSSSQDGQAIPLAVVRPLWSFEGELAAGATVGVELPLDVNLVSFYSESSRGTLSFEGGSFIFLPGVMYELALPKEVSVTVRADSEFFFNVLVKWGQLRNEGAYYAS